MATKMQTDSAKPSDSSTDATPPPGAGTHSHKFDSVAGNSGIGSHPGGVLPKPLGTHSAAVAGPKLENLSLEQALNFLKTHVTTPTQYGRNEHLRKTPPKPNEVIAALRQTGAFYELQQTRPEIIAAAGSGQPTAVLRAMEKVQAFIVLLGGSTVLNCKEDDDPATVKEHTEQVIAQFSSQSQFFKLHIAAAAIRRVPGFENFDPNVFMAALLAAHDIGKSLGSQASDQHQFTEPILRETMKELGFTPQEINLAALLVGNDILGDLQKGNINIDTAKQQLTQLANAAGIPLNAFYKLQKILYISDASSYPYVRNSFMTQNSQTKEWRFKRNRLAELESKIPDTTVEQSQADEVDQSKEALDPRLAVEGLSKEVNENTKWYHEVINWFKSLFISSEEKRDELYSPKNFVKFFTVVSFLKDEEKIKSIVECFEKIPDKSMFFEVAFNYIENSFSWNTAKHIKTLLKICQKSITEDNLDKLLLTFNNCLEDETCSLSDALEILDLVQNVAENMRESGKKISSNSAHELSKIIYRVELILPCDRNYQKRVGKLYERFKPFGVTDEVRRKRTKRWTGGGGPILWAPGNH